MLAPVLSAAPSLCLCSAPCHCCPVSASACVCMHVRMCVLKQTGWARDCAMSSVTFGEVSHSHATCVRDPQRGFPLHCVSTSLCVWSSYVRHSAFSHLDSNRFYFLSFHSFRSTFRKWFIYHLKLDGEGCSVRKRELPHYIHYCLFRRELCCIFIWFTWATPSLHSTAISGALAAFCGTTRISEIQNGRKENTHILYILI